MFSMTKYHILLNLRERTMVFWTLAFPLLLGTFFYFGLGGIDAASQFEPVPVAVLREAETDTNTEDAAQIGAEVSQADGAAAQAGAADQEAVQKKAKAAQLDRFLDAISGDLVEPQYDLTEEEADAALEDGTIGGILDARGEDPELILGKSGLESSILKALMDSYEKQSGIMLDIQNRAQEQAAEAGNYVTEASEAAEASADSSDSETRTAYVKSVSLGGREVSSSAPYYFALAAMACLYMCFLGETAARRTQANISEMGKRLSVSPVHRLKLVLSNGLSAYLIALVNITIIMLFLTKVVKGIDLYYRPGYAVLICMMGCLIGVSFGVLIESIGTWSQNIRTAILIGSSIFCAFLAGLMISSMKDIIEKHIPWLNRINPAALIADSFYCICVYDDMSRLRLNLILMGIMSAVFLLAAWLMTRRTRYDSL